MGVDSQRIARLSADSRLPDSVKGPKAAQGLKGGFLGDPVGSFVGSLPCVLLCALTIE